jgi:hypothetical protein
MIDGQIAVPIGPIDPNTILLMRTKAPADVDVPSALCVGEVSCREPGERLLTRALWHQIIKEGERSRARGHRIGREASRSDKNVSCDRLILEQ